MRIGFPVHERTLALIPGKEPWEHVGYYGSMVAAAEVQWRKTEVPCPYCREALSVADQPRERITAVERVGDGWVAAIEKAPPGYVVGCCGNCHADFVVTEQEAGCSTQTSTGPA